MNMGKTSSFYISSSPVRNTHIQGPSVGSAIYIGSLGYLGFKGLALGRNGDITPLTK